MDISSKSLELLRKYDVNVENLNIEDPYNHPMLLKPKNDIILEAKRLILNEQFEKVLSVTLYDKNFDEDINNLVQINNKASSLTTDNTNSINFEIRCLQAPESSIKRLKHKSISHKLIWDKIKSLKLLTDLDNNGLLKKYFTIWKRYTRDVNLSKHLKKSDNYQKVKMDEFLNRLKEQKGNTENILLNQINLCKSTTVDQSSLTEADNLDLKVKDRTAACIATTITNTEFCQTNKSKLGCKYKEQFSNRFKAQERIILQQRCRIIEQEKLIDDLKLGKINEDLNKSIKKSEYEIKEIFKDCTHKTKIKMSITGLTHEATMHLGSTKAPRFVREMEARALARANNQQIILERKRIIEEKRKAMLEDMLENKRELEEEQKRKNVDALLERRRKELERQKIREVNKKRFIENCKISDEFRQKKLKALVLRGFKKLIEVKTSNVELSIRYYERKLMANCFRNWQLFIRIALDENNEMVDNFRNEKVKKRIFKLLKENRLESRRNYQVACDFDDMRITKSVFRTFHLIVCREQMRMERFNNRAVIHYESRLLIQSFYQWRSLKAVLELEKAKERKLEKWRKRVLEIVPDFKPSIED